MSLIPPANRPQDERLSDEFVDIDVPRAMASLDALLERALAVLGTLERTVLDPETASRSRAIRGALEQCITLADGLNASNRPVVDGTARASAHVLVAEDNPVNQQVAVRSLAKLGCTVKVAQNGREALELFAAERFDLVLMDCQMPEMDGYQATERMRAAGGAAGEVPIIALTAHALKGDREKCLASGMNDHIAKPVRLAILQHALETWLPRPAAAAPPSAAPPPDSAPPAGDDDAAIDAAVLAELEQVVGDALDDIVSSFLDDTRTLLGEIESALRSPDPERVRSAAHQLKSSSASLGAKRLAAAMRSLEEKGATNDLAGAAALFEESRLESERIEAYFHPAA